ncbi:hypothetical protein B0H10DRAFT_902287 [Mycena sp. CBHHK59/15]|nr:hypothetical protein B0H10DRAFT_902287 [Mycena sp. CBHHK59/15]
MPFQHAKQNASQRMANVEQLHKYLAGGLSSIPQPQDNELLTPHPMFNSPAVYSQVDVETLFYVFYFCPTSYPQYLAAEELKRQSWCFHVKYLTWFQQHSEPQAITDEYEQGVMLNPTTPSNFKVVKPEERVILSAR